MDEERMRAIARHEAEKFFGAATFVKKSELEHIVDATVRKTLQGFGVDIDNPTDVQENFINLRSWSDLKRAMSQAIVTTMVRSVTMGILALLVIGFYVWLTGQKPPP